MRYIYFVCYIALVSGVSNCKGIMLFRSDYEYYAQVDGWIKVHQVPVRWQTARLRCAYEGAMLASPTNDALASVMENLAAKAEMVIYTGIHATVSEGDFNSLDGTPLSDIPVKWYPGSPNYNNNLIKNCIVYNGERQMQDVDCTEMYPYICYKKHTSDLMMTECGTTDNEYKLDRRTNKCYKFHRIGRPYHTAAGVCTAEGGHLAIINSEAEAQVMRDLLAANPGETLAASYPDATLMGYYNWDESNFFGTLHGQSLEEAGYAKWSKGQPTHQHQGKPQRCGGIYRTGLLDDVYCDDNFVFICEKDPASLRKPTIDVRYAKQN